MSKYTLAIKADFKGLTGYVASLKQDDITLKCQKVFETYKQLTVALENIAKELGTLQIQIKSYSAEFNSW
jgi:tetrahydromethanopterin S-methyltransferase subunit B